MNSEENIKNHARPLDGEFMPERMRRINSSPASKPPAIDIPGSSDWVASASHSEPTIRGMKPATMPAQMRRAVILSRFHLGAILATTFLAGCAPQIEVVSTNRSAVVSTDKSFKFARHWWDEGSLNRKVVHQHNLERLIREDQERALVALGDVSSRSRQVEDIAALSELTFRFGQTLEHTDPQKSLGLYLAAADIGYHHLIGKNEPSSTTQYELRIRESYNKATTGVVTLLQKLPGGMHTHHVASASGRSFDVEPKSGDFSSSPLYYDQWLPADGWKQRGFNVHYWNEGFGARLVAARTNHLVSPLERHRPDEGIFDHATALLVFLNVTEHAAGVQSARLIFYNPVFTPRVAVNGRRWGLAADFTMPWAMLLSRTRPLSKARWSALFHPAETSRPPRLYLMEPYSPDRIPIIMVHGLWSTPLAWRQLTNELIGDPEIRMRYQVWHYLYPTGFPFLQSAADFRDELENLRRMVDTHDHDFAMQNMVLIAHSMGGLLTRTLVTDSGDAIWNSTFAISPSKLGPDVEQLPELRRQLYFRPKSYVKRVVFVAVPHRGSKAADSLLARVVSRQVRLPDDLHALISDLRASNPNLLKPEASALFDRGYPTSIRVLSPKADGLMALADLPVDRSIPFHSIIGDRGRRDGAKSSDGFVTYASAHLPGAASELIVPSDHSAYENPQAMAEVKRILKLHLAELDLRRSRKFNPTHQ
jgi:hypothetical protein